MVQTKKRDIFYPILCALVFISNCHKPTKLIKKKVSIPQPPIHRSIANIHTTTYADPPPITIWVHGTRFLHRTIFTDFFEGKPSLKHGYLLDTSSHLRTVVNTLVKNNPIKYPLETFYLFGWSGKLYAHEREDAALHLLTQLRELIQEYIKQWKTYPKIHILTHSHGGNVILNIPRIDPTALDDIHITELVLLACPVQEKTMEYIHSPIFDKVYVFYSAIDMVQVLAPQLVRKEQQTKKGTIKPEYNLPPFSSRRFPPHKNLIQVKIKINNRAIMHTEFVHSRFLSILPSIIEVVDAWHPARNNTIPDLKNEYLLSIYSYRRSVKS